MFINLIINFHTLSFWVLILAASGPYWVLISQKKMGPYLKAWGSLLILEAVENLTWLNRVLFSISRGLEIFGKFWRFL